MGKRKAGKPIALNGSLRLADSMTARALSHDGRPIGTVRIWRRNGAGWKVDRELPKPVEVKAIRRVERGPGDLLEFTPAAGRGAPMVLASPELLNAWREMPTRPAKHS